MIVKMPDRFWAFEDEGGGVPRSGFWIDEQSECPEGSPEYARVTPGTITLPRAEVKALMEAADKIANWTIGGMLVDDPENRSKYPLLSDSIISLRKALATLQERMK